MIRENRSIYEHFCQQQKEHLPLFLYPEWLELVCPGHWQALVNEDNGEVKAAFVFQKQIKFGMPAILMPVLTPYTGLWFAQAVPESEKESLLAAFLRHLPFSVYDSLSFHHSLSISDAMILQRFKSKKRITHLIDVQPTEKALEAFSNTAKAHIRSAEKQLVVVQNDDIQSLCETMNSSFAKYGNENPISEKLIRSIWQSKAAGAKIYHAIDKSERVHASVMVVQDRHTVYHLLSGRDINAVRGAVALIIQQTVSDAMLRGKVYDFEGSSIPGIAAFFKSFGAREVVFPLWIRTFHPLAEVVLRRFGKF